MDAPNTQEVDIAGNVCESGDLFAKETDQCLMLKKGTY